MLLLGVKRSRSEGRTVCRADGDASSALFTNKARPIIKRKESLSATDAAIPRAEVALVGC